MSHVELNLCIIYMFYCIFPVFLSYNKRWMQPALLLWCWHNLIPQNRALTFHLIFRAHVFAHRDYGLPGHSQVFCRVPPFAFRDISKYFLPQLSERLRLYQSSDLLQHGFGRWRLLHSLRWKRSPCYTLRLSPFHLGEKMMDEVKVKCSGGKKC